MNNFKNSVLTLALTAILFTAIGIGLNIALAGASLSLNIVLSGLTLSALVFVPAALLTKLVGHNVSSGLVFASCSAVTTGATFYIMSVQEFNNGSLVGLVAAGSMGFLSALLGSAAGKACCAK